MRDIVTARRDVTSTTVGFLSPAEIGGVVDTFVSVFSLLYRRRKKAKLGKLSQDRAGFRY
jgi:hypothetical protein